MDLVDSGSFRRQSFVVEYTENILYPQYVTFELTQDRVELINKFNVGDKIEVTFNLKGREWTSPEGVVKYFNTLEAWRIQKPDSTAATAEKKDEVAEMAGEGEELPF